MDLPDPQLALLAAGAAATTYCVLYAVLPALSSAPLLAAVFVASNIVSRTLMFQRSVLQLRLLPTAFRRGVSLDSASGLSETARAELLDAIRSLEEYALNLNKATDRRRKLFRMMLWRQQKLADEAGYTRKLKLIDVHVARNQAVLAQVAQVARAAYGVAYSDFGKTLLLQRTSASNYRVVESLGHFIRDWLPQGERETRPMLDYVTRQLDAIIPPDEAAQTCVVMPGLGLGRVAHEVALHRPYGAVHAVEFSGLMHACHKYVYAHEDTATIYPYVHTCLNFVSAASQFRGVELALKVAQPANLHLWLDDFRYFAPPDREQYKNVVVVSVFFIDTAENLIDYFDQINQLTVPSRRTPVENGYWINFGPLKYGSAAQVELSVDEVAHIRKRMGWVDVEASTTLNDPAFGNNGVVGYITDTESLWQGYYGIAKWTAAQRTNARKTQT